MIPFNKPPYVGKEEQYIAEAIKNNKISTTAMIAKYLNGIIFNTNKNPIKIRVITA